MTAPDQPVWDGDGRDPWLPQRLEASLDVLATERSIRDAFFGALSDWLIRLSRRVLRGDSQRPDLDAVWSMVPAWCEAVDLVIEKAIEPAMRRAYTALLGDEYPWDRRVFVARYLAEVRNRMSRTPDEVYDLIAGQMSIGVNAGDSIPNLALRVSETLAATGTPRWENRATVVARTEAIGALNAARMDSFRALAEEEGGTFEKIWLSTEDSRTRPTHALADQQRVPLESPFTVGGSALMFPGDPTGPADEVIQCRCSMLLVEQGETVNMTNRQMRLGP